jgi:putative YhbY family RNA-binding protein
LGNPRGRYNRDVPGTISSQERGRLKARAHSLEPVVRMGHAGVTPELVAEVDRALAAHELIKVAIAVDDRDDRRALGDALAERVDGTPVHRVGKVLILWRPRPPASGKATGS